jgi:hypothetical protein
MAPKRFTEPVYVPQRSHGRPRKAGPLVECGHNAVTAPEASGMNSGSERGTLALHTTGLPMERRLLDLHTASTYLGMSPWTVRALEAAGTLRRIHVPLPNAGELRKILFDRVDLDRLIETWKN